MSATPPDQALQTAADEAAGAFCHAVGRLGGLPGLYRIEMDASRSEAGEMAFRWTWRWFPYPSLQPQPEGNGDRPA